MLQDNGIELRVRRALFQWFSTNPLDRAVQRAVVDQLDPAIIHELSTHALLEALGALQSGDPFIARVIGTMADDAAAVAMTACNELRAQLSMSAYELVSPFFLQPTVWAKPKLLATMLDALTNEASADGIKLLQALRNTCPKRQRADIQRALVVASTRRIESPSDDRENDVVFDGWSSIIDGKGALICLLTTVNPDRTRFMANVCLRVTDGVRSGFLIARGSERDFTSLISAPDIIWRRAPVAELAWYVQQAAARDAGGQTSPPDDPIDETCRRAVAHFMRINAIQPVLVDPAVTVSDADVKSLRASRECDTWMLDPKDVRELSSSLNDKSGVKTQPNPGPNNLRARLIAAASYVSHRARWRNDLDTAAKWAYLTQEIDRDYLAARIPMQMGFEAIGLDDTDSPSDRPTTITAWASMYPNRAGEQWILDVPALGSAPKRQVQITEFYCDTTGCDCNKVSLRVNTDDNQIVAGICHFFSPTSDWIPSSGAQSSIEPGTHSTPFAQYICGAILDRLRKDKQYCKQLERHYADAKRWGGWMAVRHADSNQHDERRGSAIAKHSASVANGKPHNVKRKNSEK